MENILSPQLIQQNTVPFFHTIQVVGETASTNDFIKQSAPYTDEGYVVIADGQTAGRGRNGKYFYSAAGKGLYLSMLLKPDFDIYHSLLVTAAAAVAAVQAVEELCGVQCGIKWVNDIFICDKKISGILCEAALKPGTAQPEYMIVGIGINTHNVNMPREISATAGSIADFAPPPDRNSLASRFLNNFYNYYQNFNRKEYMSVYRQKSNILGSEITVYENNTAYTATATGIDHMGGLIITTSDGKQKTLTTGEITIRKTAP